MRALDIGVECHFAQRLAEDTRFPDEHFDMVVSYIMFHEVTQEATQQIIAEAFRVLRPGGIFFPVDFRTGKQEGAPNAFMTFARWWDHRWNNEPWRPDFSSRDFGDSIAAVGFDVDETVESVRRGHGGILATKPV
jgi:ubiquinone/menaquinone biosynthesis C-methylase UbiE